MSFSWGYRSGCEVSDLFLDTGGSLGKERLDRQGGELLFAI